MCRYKVVVWINMNDSKSISYDLRADIEYERVKGLSWYHFFAFLIWIYAFFLYMYPMHNFHGREKNPNSMHNTYFFIIITTVIYASGWDQNLKSWTNLKFGICILETCIIILLVLYIIITKIITVLSVIFTI